MTQYIPKSALIAEIEKRVNFNKVLNAYSRADECNAILSLINTLEVKEMDLDLITGWFDHIAQIADDRKTLNGVIMEDWAALDEIKCLARNSSEFIQKYYKAQKGEEV